MNVMHHRVPSALRFQPPRSATQAVSAVLCAACCVGALGATDTAAAASDAVVLHWNEIAVEAVGDAPPFPSTRAMAAVQIAVFEAVDAITRRYQPYLGTVVASAGSSEEAAAAVAAHDTLAWLFPASQAFLDAKLGESLQAIANGSAKDQGIVVGRAAAATVIADRANDGAQAPAFYTPTSTLPSCQGTM